MCKSVLKKVTPFRGLIRKNKALDPLDFYGYQKEKQQQQLQAEAAEQQRQIEEAQRIEDQRRAQAEQQRAESIGKINAFYAPDYLRNEGYKQVRDSSLKYAMDEIARNKADAEREARFGLARNSLSGGSADLSTAGDIADLYSRSVIQANQAADNQVENLRSRDESMRADLISRINAGLDFDSAWQTANQSLMNHRNEALTSPQSQTLNNLFAGIGSAFNGYQYGKAAVNPYGALNNNSSVNSVGLAAGYKGRIS